MTAVRADGTHLCHLWPVRRGPPQNYLSPDGARTDDREVTQPCEVCDWDRLHAQYRPIASVHFGEVQVPRLIIEPGVCRARGGGGTKPNPEFLNIWEGGSEPIESRESIAESSYEILKGDNAKEDHEGGERTM